MTHIKFTFFILITAFVYSCNIINPKEDVPVFLSIDSIKVESENYALHGSTSSKITDAWVYYDGRLLGAFELPAKIPVINNGSGNITIRPGIYENGMSGDRKEYGLYRSHVFTMPNQNTTINPKVKYFDVDFILNADFENGPNFIKREGDTTIIQTGVINEKLEGIYSGKLQLDTANNYAQSITSEFYPISSLYPTYLELDYKNDIPFTIKALYNTTGGFQISELITLSKKEDWNKIYLNLSTFAGGYSTNQIKIIVEALLPSDKLQAKILLDNLKIIAIKK